MRNPAITLLALGLSIGVFITWVTVMAIPVERTKLYDRPVLEVVKTWEDGSIQLLDEDGNNVYACLRGGQCND